MEKENLKPQQKKPVVRPTLAKPTIEELSEEQSVAISGGHFRFSHARIIYGFKHY